jgi:hypothetical protein
MNAEEAREKSREGAQKQIDHIQSLIEEATSNGDVRILIDTTEKGAALKDATKEWLTSNKYKFIEYKASTAIYW